MRKLVVTAVVAALVLAAAAGPARAADGPTTFTDALRVAQQEVPSGLLQLARPEGLGTRWGFYFLIDGQIREIEVRRKGKVIIKKEDITPDRDKNVSPDVVEASKNYSGGKLPYYRYLEIAMETVSGEPSQIEVSIVGGKLVMKVTFGSGDSAKTVVMDMATGKVIK